MLQYTKKSLGCTRKLENWEARRAYGAHLTLSGGAVRGMRQAVCRKVCFVRNMCQAD